MIKKISYILLLTVFCTGLSYGYSKQYDQELQQKNKQFLESTANMNKRERRRAILEQKMDYQKQIQDKQEELFFIGKQKGTMDPKERREQMQKLKEEIENLRRAQNNLR